MQVIPFGNVIESRMDLSKKYDLIKCAGQVWLLTEKCRKHYDPISYIEYLQGKREKPKTKNEVESEKNVVIEELIRM
jgi:hypothetical protein